MRLSANQFQNVKQTAEELQEKLSVLNTAIDTQVILHILLDKGICTLDEINEYREKTRNFPKYKASYQYITEAIQELNEYAENPQSILKKMMDEKLKGGIINDGTL